MIQPNANTQSTNQWRKERKYKSNHKSKRHDGTSNNSELVYNSDQQSFEIDEAIVIDLTSLS